ncbi:MAG: PPC domain-containing protein [Candidatus Methanoculleus thermohydrogenotrophicum]
MDLAREEENTQEDGARSRKVSGTEYLSKISSKSYRWILMKFSRIIGLLAAVALIAPMVSAGGIGSGNDEVALDLLQADESATRAFYTITQGETDSHSYSVPAGTSALQVDLNWFTPDYSLKLDVFRPDGSLYGSYHDVDDGSYPDGEIRFEIPNPVSGPWMFKIYGERVTGTQLCVLNFF